jgi:hypothetical protein
MVDRNGKINLIYNKSNNDSQIYFWRDFKIAIKLNAESLYALSSHIELE